MGFGIFGAQQLEAHLAEARTKTLEARQEPGSGRPRYRSPTSEFTGPARLFAQVQWNDGFGPKRARKETKC